MSVLAAVTSWLYVLGDVDREQAREIAASNAGLVVIDSTTYADGPARSYRPSELGAMRGGDDKLIVSYLSIGEAEDYRAYWKADWERNPPAFLADANPEWRDNYKVRYWSPAWKKIVFDTVDDIIAAGFNGLYLDVIDAYEFWQEKTPNGSIDYERAMVDFIGAIRAHAEAQLAAAGDDRPFVIIGQNGEELVRQPGYLDLVDGIAKEDLRFIYENGHEGGFHKVPQDWYDGSLELLERAEAHGVEVFIVEYMTQARQAQFAGDLAALQKTLRDLGTPLYVAQDRDLTEAYPQPAEATNIRGSAGHDVLAGGSGRDLVWGYGGNDRVAGGAGDDRLAGGDGHDTLLGGLGADLLVGGLGRDRLGGGPGSDRLLGAEGDDLLLGEAGPDLLMGGAGHDVLRGGSGADILRGGAGRDILVGEAGNDVLEGGGGDDILYGGGGADRFVVPNGAARDVIRDFDPRIDRLEIQTPAAFDATQTAAGLTIRFADGRLVELVGLQADDTQWLLLG